MHELPVTSGTSESFCFSEKKYLTGLLAHIEYLESENQKLKEAVGSQKKTNFHLEDVAHEDTSIRFYTGFPSYEIFFAIFDFLGPSVDELYLWGTPTTRKQKPKLDSKNKFYFTLIRLRLNTRVKDLLGLVYQLD